MPQDFVTAVVVEHVELTNEEGVEVGGREVRRSVVERESRRFAGELPAGAPMRRFGRRAGMICRAWRVQQSRETRKRRDAP